MEPALALTLISLGWVSSAADNVCAPRDSILSSLAENFREAPAAMGMSDTGNVVEVFTARDGTTWTILITRPDGRSCVVAFGQGWTPIHKQLSESDGSI